MDGLTEVKSLIEDQGRTFEAFKAANDEMQAQIKKLGAADVVTADQVKKINGGLDELQDKFTALKKQNDDLHVKVNRPGFGAGGSDAEQKALEAWNRDIKVRAAMNNEREPAPLTLDEMRAAKRAFDRYLRKGAGGLDALSDIERKAMSVGSDPAGGYFVMPDTGGQMAQTIFETSPMRQVASVQVISTDALEGVIDNNEASGAWIAEQGTRSDSNTPNVGKWRIPVEEVYALPKTTQKLLDDAAIDIEAWLINKAGDKLGRLQNTAYVAGTGVGQPRGFTSYSTAATADASRAWGTIEHVATGTSGSYGTAPNGSDKLIDLMHKLKAGYRTGARWAMSRATLGTTRQLKANNEYIWLPAMNAAQEQSLLGYPITEMEDIPAIGANSLSVWFGNWRLGYQIVDRHGVRVLRDPFSSPGFVRFYVYARTGGDVLNFEAIKTLKFA